MSASARMLPDGRRLHLHHGPIDVIAGVDGPGRAAACAAMVSRFGTVLDELVAELPLLRRPVCADDLSPEPKGSVAGRMVAATRPFLPAFITPMAAVAGAVADELIAVAAGVPGVSRAYANNGGDIALHLTDGTSFTGMMAGGRVRIGAADALGGIATSGWRGRSHSLGIADSVTVIARTAAGADAAATMIANAVDLPGHPAISRRCAADLVPESDLGQHPVTVAVGWLGAEDISRALDAGAAFAETCLARGVIAAAFLTLAGAARSVTGDGVALLEPEELHA